MKLMNQKWGDHQVLLVLAIFTGLLFHGTAFMHTLESSYDYYVHLFFADHYLKSWFEPWEYRWYTGFTLFSYPPLVHQLIALLATLIGLKASAYLLCLGLVVLYVSGIYRFAKIVCRNHRAAAYAALIGVFLPSTIETFHLFGQLPMMMGISCLLHAIPEIYHWVRYRRALNFFAGITIIAVAVASHHVTPIFGMVFFVLPIMATAILDDAYERTEKTRNLPWKAYWQALRRGFRPAFIFGVATILVTILVILPYWIYSHNDPIVQVPIPHGSRDSFLEVGSSGLVFFLIPWGYLIFLLPFICYRLFNRRNLFMGFAFALLFVLGTGGTTPIPRILLGDNAFSILTLERFTFWATMWSAPIAGEFLCRFFHSGWSPSFTHKASRFSTNIMTGFIVLSIFLSAVAAMNLPTFRPTQPPKVELQPILNFLNMDKHYKWRYLTLGFGDQMAWLATNTRALTIDGNYHSARRVPELVSRAVERLENSKYRGFEGLGSLQEFITTPEKYHLKYIFSNDKFYDPLLYFGGWHRVKVLDNNITIWERSDIPPLPSKLPLENFPVYQKIWWGIAPMLILLLAFFCNVQLHWINQLAHNSRPRLKENTPDLPLLKAPNMLYKVCLIWSLLIFVLYMGFIYRVYWLNLKQNTPTKVVQSFYDAIDKKEFETSHGYFDPQSGLSLDQYLLENSVSNGIVESYGKLNSVVTQIANRSSKEAMVSAHLQWISPLNAYQKKVSHQVIKREDKWYIIPDRRTPPKPPEQFVAKPYISFFNQQRRRLTMDETFHEDVLDRPVIHLKEARLIKTGELFSVVGQLQNVDNNPADISIKAILLNAKGQELARHNVRFAVVHKLLPKESSPFRIDFTKEQWPDLTGNRTPVFDPAPFEVMEFDDSPVDFKVEILATLAKQDLYRDLVLNVAYQKGNIQGIIFNNGTQSVTVPQILLGFVDENNRLKWVEHLIVEKSVDPQKKSTFNYRLPSLKESMLISENPVFCTVNGLLNDALALKHIRRSHPEERNLLQIPGSHIRLLVKLNPFVDNPSGF